MSSGGPPSTNATPSAPSYPSGVKTGSMTVSHGLVPRPAAPSNSYATYAGQRPPMYPGKKKQLKYQIKMRLHWIPIT